MSKILKYAAIAVIFVVSLFGLSSAAHATSTEDTSGVTNSKVIEQPSGDAVVGDPGLIEQFGPPSVIISTVLGGILLIFRSINEGKKIDVTTYKERAAEAEARSNAEIGKVHKKLGELEKKLDDVIKDRDEYRNTLEERKAHFTAQILDMEKRHQRELEDMHAALMIEVHTRHALERLLAENGIKVPGTPPPYTKEMKDAAQRQVDTTTQALKTIRENE